MIDPTRLYTALLNTGLQQKDNALYQVIHDLIGNLTIISKQINITNITNTNSVIQGIQGMPGNDGEDGETIILLP